MWKIRRYLGFVRKQRRRFPVVKVLLFITLGLVSLRLELRCVQRLENLTNWRESIRRRRGSGLSYLFKQGAVHQNKNKKIVNKEPSGWTWISPTSHTTRQCLCCVHGGGPELIPGIVRLPVIIYSSKSHPHMCHPRLVQIGSQFGPNGGSASGWLSS